MAKEVEEILPDSSAATVAAFSKASEAAAAAAGGAGVRSEVVMRPPSEQFIMLQVRTTEVVRAKLDMQT
jgi:hypothetical protein